MLQGERYWFTKEEADRITEQNVPFQRTINLQSMLRALYRQPRPDETPESVTVPDIIDELLVRYPSLELSHDANIQVGMAMKSLGFTKMRTNSQRTYHLIRVTTCPARKTTP